MVVIKKYKCRPNVEELQKEENNFQDNCTNNQITSNGFYNRIVFCFKGKNTLFMLK